VLSCLSEVSRRDRMDLRGLDWVRRFREAPIGCVGFNQQEHPRVAGARSCVLSWLRSWQDGGMLIRKGDAA
jgi:hypothetical protein